MNEASLVRSAAAMRYLLSLDEIEGWLDADTALAMIELGWEQARLGLSSGMAEIGVHHGKSFLALAACAEPDEPVFAIDVFERQDLNIDYSGCGNRDMFLRNVAKFFPAVSPRIIAGSSEELRGQEAAHGLTGLRFFSVDGGHTTALTVNDLQIADAALAPAGICALDDILNEHWTGVLTGAFSYFSTGGSLVPFCLVPNKLLLCRPEFRTQYRSFMKSAFPYALEKQDLEFGPAPVDVYGAMWGTVDDTFARLADTVFERERQTLKAMCDQAASEAAAERQHNADLEGELARANAGRADLEAARLTLEARCADVEAASRAREEEMAQQVAARREAEERLERTLASTSWRMTGPLRAVARLVK